MAITGAALQAELGTGAMDPRVIREFPNQGTLQQWYIHGGETYRGRVRMVETTASDNASTQATSVANAMKA